MEKIRHHLQKAKEMVSYNIKDENNINITDSIFDDGKSVGNNVDITIPDNFNFYTNFFPKKYKSYKRRYF